MPETTIPFSGFYETIHSRSVGDRALMEYGCEDEEHNTEDYQNAQHCESDNCTSKATREQYIKLELEYCKEYVENFSKLIAIPLTFKDMSSPREYNFMTDRIFAEISEENVEKMKAAVDPVLIRAYVKKHFTSRDGFISWYDNEYDNWLKQEKPFDHNQIGALIAVYAMWINPDWEEEVYDDTQGNF